MPLRLITLGEIRLDGELPAGASRPRATSRAMALLVWLRVRNRGVAVPRASLGGVLWSEQNADGRTVTRNAISDLRPLLGPALESLSERDDALRIEPTALECDYDDLLTLLDRPADATDRTLGDSIVRVMRGELLQTWTAEVLRPSRARSGTVRYGAPFADWVAAERTALRRRAIGHIQSAAADALQHLDWERLDRFSRFILEFGDGPAMAPAAWVWAGRAAMELGDRTRIEHLYNRLLASGQHDPPTLEHFEAFRSHDAPTANRARVAATAPSPAPMPASLKKQTRVTISLAAATIGVVAFIGWRVHTMRTAEARSPVSEPVCDATNANLTLDHHNYQLGSVMKPAQHFTKGWWLRIGGRCRWDPSVVRLALVQTGPAPLALVSAAAAPRPQLRGPLVLAEVPMRAPHQPGDYWERWSLVDKNHATIPINGSGAALLAQISVLASAPPCGTTGASAILAGRGQAADQTFLAGSATTAIWSFVNDGACAWPRGVRLVRTSRSELTTSDVIAPDLDTATTPGATATFRTNVDLPSARGRFHEDWSLRLADGTRIPIGGARSTSLDIVGVSGMQLPAEDQPRPCGRGESIAGWIGEAPLDSAVLYPGERFQKVWTISNTGSCAWQHVRLAFRDASGPRLTTDTVLSSRDRVYPGSVFAFAAKMRAPKRPGTYKETWYVRDQYGAPMYITRTDTVWVIVRVQSAASAAAPLQRESLRLPR